MFSQKGFEKKKKYDLPLQLVFCPFPHNFHFEIELNFSTVCIIFSLHVDICTREPIVFYLLRVCVCARVHAWTHYVRIHACMHICMHVYYKYPKGSNFVETITIGFCGDQLFINLDVHVTTIDLIVG